MPKATVTAIKDWGKGRDVTLTINDKSKVFKTWNSDQFAPAVTVGAVIDFETEERDSPSLKDESGNPVKQQWITSVNGTAAKPPKPFGGGGRGGFQQAPKDDASIAAQVIVKEVGHIVAQECITSGAKTVGSARVLELTEVLSKAYVKAYEIVKGVNGKA